MVEWISVDEQLPRVDDHVIYYMHEYVLSGSGIVFDANYKQGGEPNLYVFDGEKDLKFSEYDITHWMLFPELPK